MLGSSTRCRWTPVRQHRVPSDGTGFRCSHAESGGGHQSLSFFHDHHESCSDRPAVREGGGRGTRGGEDSYVYMVLIKLWTTKRQSVSSEVKWLFQMSDRIVSVVITVEHSAAFFSVAPPLLPPPPLSSPPSGRPDWSEQCAEAASSTPSFVHTRKQAVNCH